MYKRYNTEKICTTTNVILSVSNVLLVLYMTVFTNVPVEQDKAIETTAVETYISETSETLAPIEIETTVPDTSEPLVPETTIAPVEEPVEFPFTDEEIDLIALVTFGEAEGEPEEGQRMVIDVILNRLDSEHFPDTVYDVIWQRNQFTTMWSNRLDACYVRDDIRQLVIEEIESRTNTDVIYFRTNYYHSYGTPLFRVGNHYFSKY